MMTFTIDKMMICLSVLCCMFKVSLSVRFKVFSTTSVVSTLGSDVVLPCRLTPEMNAEKMEIRWFNSMYQPYVHLYINGKDDYSMQMPQFTNRTELIKENITRGVFPLRIHNVTAQDSGKYYCFVESTEHHGRTTVLLNVTGSCNMKICSDPHSELKQGIHSPAQNQHEEGKRIAETSMKTRTHLSLIGVAVLFVCLCTYLKKNPGLGKWKISSDQPNNHSLLPNMPIKQIQIASFV